MPIPVVNFRPRRWGAAGVGYLGGAQPRGRTVRARPWELRHPLSRWRRQFFVLALPGPPSVAPPGRSDGSLRRGQILL